MTITKCQQEEKNVQEPFSRWKLQYLRKKGRAAAFWPFSESVPARVGRTHAVGGLDLDKNAIQRIECGKSLQRSCCRRSDGGKAETAKAVLNKLKQGIFMRFAHVRKTKAVRSRSRAGSGG